MEFDFLPVIIINWIIDHTIGLFYSSKEKKEELYFKQKTYNSEKGTYYDSKCRERRYLDDSFVFTRRNSLGEIEIEYQDGTKRNLSQEKYDKEPGSVTRLAGYDVHNKSHYLKTAIGHRFKDRKNGKIYVIRYLKYNNNYFNFYLDVETGKLVRPTDGQIKLEKGAKENNKEYYTEEDFIKIIEYFNSRIDDSRIYKLYRNEDNSVEYSDETINHIIKIRRDLS